MLIDGIHVPLTAPFTRSGEIFLSKLAANVRRYSLSPVAGLIAFSPLAEATALSDAEILDCWQTIRDAAAPEKVLTANISHDSLQQTLKAAERAFDAGFDCALVGPPSTWRMLSPGTLLAYVLSIADKSPLPLLWSEERIDVGRHTLHLTRELARHPNVVGVLDRDLTSESLSDIRAATAGAQYESTVTTTFRPVTRRMLAAQQNSELLSTDNLIAGTSTTLAPPALKMRTRKHGFAVLHAGAASQMLPLLQAGANGVASRLAASAPQASYEPYAAFTDGDPALSALKAARLQPGDEVLEELGPAAVKHAADLNGYYGGPPRLPVHPLTAEERARVETAFRDLRS
jgi:dihydrodipicolinate synthase/N-acetylneuraminate lyase